MFGTEHKIRNREIRLTPHHTTVLSPFPSLSVRATVLSAISHFFPVFRFFWQHDSQIPKHCKNIINIITIIIMQQLSMNNPTIMAPNTAFGNLYMNGPLPSAPSSSSYCGVGPKDILCGKGRRCFEHAGNHRYRVIIGMSMERYNKQQTKSARSAIVRDVTELVLASGARFLKRGKDDSGDWQELSREEARIKVSQTMRDAARGSRSTANTKAAARRQQEVPIATRRPSVVSSSRVPNDCSASMPAMSSVPSAGMINNMPNASTEVKNNTNIETAIKMNHPAETTDNLPEFLRLASEDITIPTFLRNGIPLSFNKPRQDRAVFTQPKTVSSSDTAVQGGNRTAEVENDNSERAPQHRLSWAPLPLTKHDPQGSSECPPIGGHRSTNTSQLHEQRPSSITPPQWAGGVGMSTLPGLENASVSNAAVLNLFAEANSKEVNKTKGTGKNNNDLNCTPIDLHTDTDMADWIAALATPDTGGTGSTTTTNAALFE